MRRILFIVLTALGVSGAVAMTMNKNRDSMAERSEGHHLTALWEEYDRAAKADRPQKMSETLQEIRAEALRLHYAEDFYDAGVQYVAAVRRRDWKAAEAAREEWAKEVEQFGDPLVTLLWMSDYGGASASARFAYVQANEAALRSRRHTYFYEGLPQMGGMLGTFLSSDYEYALWRLFSGRSLDSEAPEKDPVYRALREESAGRYPGEAYLAFYVADRLPAGKSEAVLDALARKYADRAVGFWPRQALLQRRWSSILESRAASEEFKAFLTECEAFERGRAALKGDEERIASGCTAAKNFIAELRSEGLGLSVSSDTVHVSFRNLKDAQVTVYRGDTDEKLLTREMRNTRGSFYVMDEETFVLPRLDDGSYTLKAVSGKHSAAAQYQQYTLSVAVRRDRTGWAVYVADYRTGEPVRQADLTLYVGDQAVEKAENFEFQGFTRLPAAMQTLLGEKNRQHYLSCARTEDGFLRSSKQVGVSAWRSYEADGTDAEETYGQLYMDRGAYHPGDTVKFKAVLYSGDLIQRVQTVAAGLPVEAKLYDSEGNELTSKNLSTNDFGSAAGEFALPAGLRNGHFRIQISRKGDGGRVLCGRSFVVDEFVPPAFEVNFEKNDRLYLPGDTVEVRGRLESYSGHSLGGAKIRAKVMLYGTVVSEEGIRQEADGAFSVQFPAAEEGTYSVEVTVSDATGETQTCFVQVAVVNYIYVNVELMNAADGEFDLAGGDRAAFPPVRGRRYAGISKGIVQEDAAVFSFTVRNAQGEAVQMDVAYTLSSEEGTELASGAVPAGGTLRIDLADRPSGLYRLTASAGTARADGTPLREEQVFVFLKMAAEDRTLDAPVDRLFLSSPDKVEDGAHFRVQFGCADGPVWAVAELFGKDYERLEQRLVYLGGVRGAESSLASLDFEYKEAYPDAVMLYVFYFRSGKSWYWNHAFRRVRHTLDLPLAFSSFEDRTGPSAQYTFTLKTLPGVEAVAAVFDKSLDAFAPNRWQTVTLRQFAVYAPGISSEEGSVGEVWNRPLRLAYAMYSKAATEAAAMDAAPAMAMAVNEIAEEDVWEAGSGAGEAAAFSVREKFEAALTFQPFLRSDPEGNLSFSFSTSDKLSTYHVQVFAHDRDMRNHAVTRDMTVTVPVKVSVLEPRFLYEGDECRIAVTVSNNADRPVTGQVRCYVHAGPESGEAEPHTVPLTVPAGGEEAVSFAVDAPAGADSLRVKAVFASEEFTDGVFVKWPVYRSEQTLAESHSAVLLAGMSRDSLLAELRGRFVNAPAAADSEISVLDMVREALPSKAEPSGKDVLSLSEAYYVRVVSAALRQSGSEGSALAGDSPEAPEDAGLLEKILACRNGDGGFGWFEGMKSSPVITAVLLERFARLRESGFPAPDLTASVKYLDQRQFTGALPFWCGWISDPQYLYVRSLYPAVPWEQPKGEVSDKRVQDFKKYVQEYLIPKEKDGRGLDGHILDKARRIKTLYNLSSSGEALALAKAWGIRFGAAGKIDRSMEADAASLLEYAVPHPDGGYYYPNAVLPFRGLLESEAYAHALICGLLTDMAGRGGGYPEDPSRIADGIRLWLMLQKETQQWGEDPAWVDAIHAVLSGSEAVKATKVLVCKAEYTRPFREIKAAGNGFTIARQFYRSVTVRDEDSGRDKSELQEIQPGTLLHRGDKIVIRYAVWSQENRSFVKLTAPREAALQPVQQLSGHYGWWLAPLRVSGGYSFSPQGYRNVKADRTEYFFDSYPEEKTEISEEFFVTRGGAFTAPVVTIESLYAPHYRANDGFRGALTAE